MCHGTWREGADGVAGAAGGVVGSGTSRFTGVIPALWCTTYVGKGIVTPDMLPMFRLASPLPLTQ